MVGRMGLDRDKEAIPGSLVPELELLVVSRAAVLCRAILKSMIIFILHHKQHGSTAFLRRVYCMRCFHLAINAYMIVFISSCLCVYVVSSCDLAVLPYHCDVKPFI